MVRSRANDVIASLQSCNTVIGGGQLKSIEYVSRLDLRRPGVKTLKQKNVL